MEAPGGLRIKGMPEGRGIRMKDCGMSADGFRSLEVGAKWGQRWMLAIWRGTPGAGGREGKAQEVLGRDGAATSALGAGEGKRGVGAHQRQGMKGKKRPEDQEAGDE